MLKEREPEKHLARLGELGILKQIHPELDVNSEFGIRSLRLRATSKTLHSTLYFALWLSSLPHDSVEEVIARLKFSSKVGDVIRQVSEIRLLIPHLTPELKFSELHQGLGEFDRDLIPLLLILCDDDSLRTHLTEYATRITQVHIATDGDTLKALGLTPSPLFKKIITRLQDAYLDGEIKNVEEEKKLLERIVLESKIERSSV